MKVLFVGDSRNMKGGVSTVMKTLEKSSLWKMFNCKWVETQINTRNKLYKIIYLLGGCIKGIFNIPKFDIVHFQTTPGKGMITLLPLFLYTLLCRKKIVVQLHMGNQIETYVNDFIFRFWVCHSNLILFLGHTWEAKIKPFLPEWVKTDYIYNPVPIQAKQISYNKYFLYAAYFNENKGCDIIIKAFAKIVTSHSDWNLIMCGTGDVTLVKRWIKECKLEGKVKMTGWVEGEEKHLLFANAGAYCMTSYQEGLPMSVIEAMSYGVPIITTPVGCLPELLKNEQSALFFDFGNVNELAACMERLIGDYNLRQQISNRAYNIAKNCFFVDTVVHRLEQIYNHI